MASPGIVKLTEQQASALIHDDLDGAGPCLMNEGLNLTDLAAASVVPNARILMAELDGKGATLTAKSNLNRKLVESLVDRFQWQGYPAERIRDMNKVINEDDWRPADALMRSVAIPCKKADDARTRDTPWRTSMASRPRRMTSCLSQKSTTATPC